MISASSGNPLASQAASPPGATVQPAFQDIWNLAWESYKTNTRRDVFKKNNHLREELEGCSSVDAITEVLKRHDDGFRNFRDGEARLRDVIKPIFRILQVVNDTGAEAAAYSNHVPGGKAIFVAIGFLFQAAKGVTQAYDAIEAILSKFASALGRLNTHLEAPMAMSIRLREVFVLTLVELIKTISLVTKYVEEEVGRTRKERAKKFLSRTAKRTVDFGHALLEKTEVKDALARLDRIVQEEVMTLLTETHGIAREISTNVQETRGDIREINKSVMAVDESVNAVRDNVIAIGSDITEIKTNATSTQKDARQTNVQVQQLVHNNIDGDIRHWLDPPDPDQNQERLQKQKQDGTCDWFFNAAFKKWRDRGTGIYWVHGSPGTGKSVLCSSVIKNLRDAVTRNGILAYFYFDFRTETKKTLRGLLCSLIFQLAVRSQTCYDALRSCRSNNWSSLHPTEDILSACLAEMLASTSKTFIVIDALDECPEVTRRRDVFPFIRKLAASLNDSCLNIFVTSRPEYDIRTVFSPLCVRSLSLQENGEHSRDIDRYISRTLEDPIYYDWNERVKSRAKEILKSKANGMFLWVYLQLETLRVCAPKHVERTLDHLPATIHETYERVLESILASSNPTRIADVRRLFECIAFTEHTLSPEELAEVFAIDFDHEDGARINSEHRLENPIKSLLTICPGFIQISERYQYRSCKVERIQVVEFTHFSVREYLSSASLPARFQPFSFTPRSARATLAQMCLATLTSGEEWERLPLSGYAARYMYESSYYPGDHASDNHEGINKLLQRFLSPEHPFFKSFCSKGYWTHDQPLHWAASCGLIELAKWMLNSMNLNRNVAVCGWGTALCVAADYGHLDGTTVPATHGASVASNSSYISALQFASMTGRDEIITLLLEHGAPMTEPGQTRTPLHEAARYFQVSTAHLLVNSGADINALDDQGRTPLHVPLKQMCLFGERYAKTIELVALFIERGAALEAQDYNGLAPLHLAAEIGSVEVVKTLLELGVNVHARTNASRYPLHFAACAPYRYSTSISALSTIALLLRYGAAINSRDCDGVTPLHLAAQYGELNTFLALLDHGATIDIVANNGYTPFHFAVRGRNASIARFLIEQRQAFVVHFPSGWTPQHIAAMDTMKTGADILIALMNAGIDIEERTKNGNTALSIAASTDTYYGHADDLLDQGANINATDAFGFKPIDYAIVLGSVCTVALIERGADTYTNSTPLGSCWEMASTAVRAIAAEEEGRAWRRYGVERAQQPTSKKWDLPNLHSRRGDGRALDLHRLLTLRPAFPRGERMMRRVRRFKSFEMQPDLRSWPIERQKTYAEWKKGREKIGYSPSFWRKYWEF